MEKKALLGMTLDELRSVAAEMGMPAFTAGQMARWIYKSHVADISEMTNISLRMRTLLAERYTVGCQPPADCQRSVDGTVKYLFPTAGGQMVTALSALWSTTAGTATTGPSPSWNGPAAWRA